MIEVEIRGRLSDDDFHRITEFLRDNGELLEKQDREMILLRGYPGYSKDPTVRDVDIRLRNTNGFCEIMVKKKSSEHNVARQETSLALQDTDLRKVKSVMKAFGFSSGIWMHRKKDVYRYNNAEWSVVDVPQGLRYFEVEREVKTVQEVEEMRQRLEQEASQLGLTALHPEEMRIFIAQLDEQVNKEIEW